MATSSVGPGDEEWEEEEECEVVLLESHRDDEGVLLASQRDGEGGAVRDKI
jgi:hypothetical protein